MQIVYNSVVEILFVRFDFRFAIFDMKDVTGRTNKPTQVYSREYYL